MHFIVNDFFICLFFLRILSFTLDENEGPTAHHHMSALNHVTHLSPVVPMPQVSSVNSYTPISTVKHLESQISTAVPPGNSYNTQTHTSYAPMASYSLPSVAPFEQVQTVVKPYHTSMPAVKHIEPQMNSIVPMHSVSHVTAYNQLPSATHYAQMQSVTPFEHIQTIVKPYPVYIKEEQHQPAYIVEQSAPSPSPPPPSVASNFWHPDTFVYNKPTFTYHNSAGMNFYLQIELNFVNDTSMLNIIILFFFQNFFFYFMRLFSLRLLLPIKLSIFSLRTSSRCTSRSKCV